MLSYLFDKQKMIDADSCVDNFCNIKGCTSNLLTTYFTSINIRIVSRIFYLFIDATIIFYFNSRDNHMSAARIGTFHEISTQRFLISPLVIFRGLVWLWHPFLLAFYSWLWNAVEIFFAR